MKKLYLPFLGALLISSVISCNVKDKIAENLFKAFVVDAAEFDMVIPQVPASTDYVPLGSDTVYFNLDSTVKSYTSGIFSAADVKKVSMELIELELDGTDAYEADEENNFANLEKIRLLFYSDGSNPIVYEIAEIPDTYTTRLSFPVDKTKDIKEHLMGKFFTYDIYAQVRRNTTHELKGKMKIKFKIGE